MIAMIIGGLAGATIGGTAAALLFGRLAYSKGFDKGLRDGKSQSLWSVADSGGVHISVDRATAVPRASGNGSAASLRSEQVRNDG